MKKKKISKRGSIDLPEQTIISANCQNFSRLRSKIKQYFRKTTNDSQKNTQNSEI